MERSGLEAVALRTEALNGPGRKIRIFVPGTERGLALKAVRERGTPLIVEDPLQGHPPTLDVRPVVIVARPLRVVGHRGVDPGARRERVSDEAAAGVAERGEPQAERPLDERGIERDLIGPIFLAALNMAAGEVDAAAERVHVRLVRDVTYGAGHGARAEGRTLRAVQHFDALDVV